MDAGFDKLTCLSIGGLRNLCDDSLMPLQGLPSLRNLDLGGLINVSNGAGPILASLPHLQHLDLRDTSVGDQMIEALTYSRRLAAWAQRQGVIAVLPVLG